jgi:hypothetical protein
VLQELLLPQPLLWLYMVHSMQNRFLHLQRHGRKRHCLFRPPHLLQFARRRCLPR